MKHKHIYIILALGIISCQQKSGSEAKNYKVAYNVLVDAEKDDYDIFTVSPEGGETRNISNNPDVAWTYSNVGNKLFYISDKNECPRCFFLYVMDPDGKNDQKITNFRLQDSWMGFRYNGTEIIVNPHKSVDSLFYIIDVEGNIIKKVNTGLTYASDPTFSPDGKKIAFRGANIKSKREDGFIDEIYTISDDGTDLKKLTNYPSADTTAQWYAYKSGPPQWHPTEDFISYSSFQNGKYNLYGTNTNGDKQWKLFDHPMNIVYHNWSSDGKWLVMDISDVNEKQYHIALMNWESQEMKILTDTLYTYQQSPVFIELSK